MRAAVIYLLATGLLPRAPTIPPDGKQEGLACAAFDIRNTDGTTDESNLAPTIAPVVTTCSTIGGGRGCNKFVPVLGGNGPKTAPTGDTFDQPPGQMR